MHTTCSFSIKEITKIEGHANLNIELRNGRVEKCELNIFEGQRFFEQMLVGKHFSQVPLIVSRICGFCNTSHLNTSIEAIEKAFSVKPSDQTLMLRELATNAEFIKSHVLHLVFLVLPDFLGKESAFDFTGEETRYLRWAMDLKKVASDLLKALGGRVYPTISIRPGGFTALPTQSELNAMLPALRKAKETASALVDLIDSFKQQFPFERKTEYVALVGSKYCMLCGQVRCSDGTIVPEGQYAKHIKEFIVPYSTAKQAHFNGKEYMVGSLARMNMNQKELCDSAIEKIALLGLRFPSNKIYYNNIAQAIELLQCIESSIEIIESLKLRKEPLSQIVPKEAEGIGITEAPRGTLYHHYSFDSKGLIRQVNIIVPTLQNNRNIELDLHSFIPTLLDLPQEKAELEIEKLIRAYDPCISCATHFLKVNWRKH
jgi:coenzyme F420-reducing hydrogenase alpha subunit